MGVSEAVAVIVGVSEGVGVNVSVGVGVLEDVAVGVSVAVAVAVALAVGVSVGVNVGVNVAEGVGENVMVGVTLGSVNTLTESVEELLFSLLSVIFELGSTVTTLVRDSRELGVTGSKILKLPPTPSVTESPKAMQVRVFEEIEHEMFPALVILVVVPSAGVPKVMLDEGNV